MSRKPGDLPDCVRYLTSSERRGRFYVKENFPGSEPGFSVVR